MWYKKDSGYWVNPTWLAMPWASALTFDYLLADCKMFGGREGRVSVTHWQPETILHVMRLPVPAEDIRAAMDALEACGKVIVLDGEVTVAEWKEFQTDPTNADRQKKHRVTVKPKSDSNSAVTGSNGYETQGNGAVTLRTVSNGEIEKREKREERREILAPAHVVSNLQDPRGYEGDWEWENLPDELTDQLSDSLSDVSHDLAIRLLWYWPQVGQQWAEETAVQTLKLYADKGLDVKLSLAQAAGKYHRSDAEIYALRGQLASWMANDLNKMKRATGQGGPGLVVVPEPSAEELEMRRLQKMFDDRYGKKPANN